MGGLSQTPARELLHCLAFRPDGKQLAAGFDDIVLFDTVTGQETRTLKSHTRDVKAIAYSPDGNRLASLSDDLTLRIWNVTTGEELCSLGSEPYGSQIRSYELTTSAVSMVDQDMIQFAGAATGKGSVRLWQFPVRQESQTLFCPQVSGRKVQFSPGGDMLAADTQGTQIKLWDAKSGRELGTLSGHTADIACMEFSPNGKILASAGEDGRVILWDAEKKSELRSLTGHQGTVDCLVFSQDGALLASGSSDRTVKLWEVATGREVQSFRDCPDEVRCLAFSADGSQLAAGSLRVIKIWNTRTNQLSLTLGKGLPTGNSGDPLWELNQSKPAPPDPGTHQTWIGRMAFSSDAERLHSEDYQRKQLVWDLRSGKSLRDEKWPDELSNQDAWRFGNGGLCPQVTT